MSIQSDSRAGQREFAEWLREHGVRRTYTVDNGRKITDDGWEHFSWTITVANRGANAASAATYQFPYMQGLGYTKPPELTDLMAALLNDASTIVNSAGFEDWASELGYDSDSRTAERLYGQVVDNNAKLAKLFGTADLAALLDAVQPILERAGL